MYFSPLRKQVNFYCGLVRLADKKLHSVEFFCNIRCKNVILTIAIFFVVVLFMKGFKSKQFFSFIISPKSPSRFLLPLIYLMHKYWHIRQLHQETFFCLPNENFQPEKAI